MFGTGSEWVDAIIKLSVSAVGTPVDWRAVNKVQQTTEVIRGQSDGLLLRDSDNATLLSHLLGCQTYSCT
jgi:hypothetical protein